MVEKMYDGREYINTHDEKGRLITTFEKNLDNHNYLEVYDPTKRGNKSLVQLVETWNDGSEFIQNFEGKNVSDVSLKTNGFNYQEIYSSDNKRLTAHSDYNGSSLDVIYDESEKPIGGLFKGEEDELFDVKFDENEVAIIAISRTDGRERLDLFDEWYESFEPQRGFIDKIEFLGNEPEKEEPYVFTAGIHVFKKLVDKFPNVPEISSFFKN